jgi:hypothetical protein
MHTNIALAQCLEKGKHVVRTVKLIDKLPERALYIYDKIRECKLQTGWESPLTLELLLGTETVVWQVDDVGIICLHFGPRPHVHVFFWDRRLRGREKMCRFHAAKILREYGFTELWTVIPQGMDVIAAFARRVGFKLQLIEQGRLILRVTARELHNATTRS